MANYWYPVMGNSSAVTGSGAAGQVSFFSAATAISGSNNLYWDNVTSKLGIGTNSPSFNLHVREGDPGGNVVDPNGVSIFENNNSAANVYINSISSGAGGTDSNFSFATAGTPRASLHYNITNNFLALTLSPAGTPTTGLFLKSNNFGINDNDPTAPITVKVGTGADAYVTDTNATVQIASSQPASNVWNNVKAGGTDANYGFAVGGSATGALHYNIINSFLALTLAPGATPTTGIFLRNNRLGVNENNPSATLHIPGTALFALTDNTASVFQILQGADNYFTVNTNNASESISFGNATTNPTYSFLGSGNFQVNGPFDHNGSTFGALGASPASQQTGGAQTAGAAYGATEQDMLQKAYNALRTFGFLS